LRAWGSSRGKEGHLIAGMQDDRDEGSRASQPRPASEPHDVLDEAVVGFFRTSVDGRLLRANRAAK
jgi:hypothetical protein